MTLGEPVFPIVVIGETFFWIKGHARIPGLIFQTFKYINGNHVQKKGETFASPFVELLGFEPRQTEPKSVVLPLHHSSISPKHRQAPKLGVQK